MASSRIRVPAALVLVAFTAGAHEIDVSVQLAAPAAVVRASYGGSEPVAFAKVEVFAPGEGQQQYQVGNTDRRGYFGFVPERSGTWRVVVDDEEGHRREVEVAIPNPFQARAHAAAPGPRRLDRLLVGLAVMIGLTGFLYGFKARRARA